MHKIMLLTSSLYIGGAERVIATLARHLDRSRFHVTIAHLKERGSIGDELAEQGYDVVNIPSAEHGPSRYLSFRALRRVVRERGIDLVHTHTTYALVDGAICRLASLGRTRLVHTFHFGNYPHYPRRYMLMERVASRAADHLVPVGVEQMRVLQSLYKVPGGRITAILNGTERPVPALDPEWTDRLRADGRVVIGTTATFIEQKGLEYLIDVAHAVEQSGGGAVFVLVGDGPLRPKLEARCRELGLERTVLFAGWKKKADATMTPLYDVFFQPSLWEAMSVVVLEAMAASKPVVVTDVGDNRHVVVDGSTGFVVEPRDVTGMAERLRRLVASPGLRREYGEAGRRRFDERYTADVMARTYERLYERVLCGTPQGEPASADGSVSA
jgi:glycosyltransferase involved in cell wall biosynthesis